MNRAQSHCKTYCSRFGTIAVELKYISIEQLKWALEQQIEDNLAGRPHRVLGAICFAHGWMAPEQIEFVLNMMFKARQERSNGADAETQAAV